MSSIVGSTDLPQLPYIGRWRVDGPPGIFPHLCRRWNYNQLLLSSPILYRNAWQCMMRKRRNEGCQACIHNSAPEGQTKPKSRLWIEYPRKAAFSSATWRRLDSIRWLLSAVSGRFYYLLSSWILCWITITGISRVETKVSAGVSSNSYFLWW